MIIWDSKGVSMIQERLFALHDEKYREFQRSLIPGLPRENIIGIRIPAMRKLAKEFVKSGASHQLYAAVVDNLFEQCGGMQLGL